MPAAGAVDVSVYGSATEGKRIAETSEEQRENKEKEKPLDEMKVFRAGKNAPDGASSNVVEIMGTVNNVESIKTTDDSSKSSLVKPEAVEDSYTSISKVKKMETEFLKLKLESEEILRKESLNRLAEDNFKKGNKLFYYPEVVKPDQNIDIFFNRSFSPLKNEPDVMIMGAFNDWKWKSFTIELRKSDLKGDWWSCQVFVPKEAYKIDFVFNNGKDVYDNNDKQDFSIVVEGGMNVFDFEDFLLEEKRREQEELAKQKAEREKREEEQRRIEAERVACEADRAQARDEAAMKREMLQEYMKKTMTSADDVWYIKPSEFGSNETVRLYYNRSSGPLSNSNEIWIHGGHNNWKDGLAIVSKLFKSKIGGDWWFADGTLMITS